MNADNSERLDTNLGPLFGSSERLDLLRKAANILVIDNEPVNLRLVTSMLHHAGYRHVATMADATELEQHLAATPPDLVVLDLHMPTRDGFDVIRALQPLIVGEYLPVLVVSGDSTSEARRMALALGARDFLTKPFDLTEMTLRVRNQLETRLLFQDVRKQNRALVETIYGRTRELEFTRIEMLERLALAAEYRDDDTSRHTERVGTVSAAIAKMLGVSPEEVSLIRRAAPLHDVGKIGIPDALLLKPSSLTEQEMAVMQTHTVIGSTILGGSQAPLLQLAEVIARTHHERWDGRGYPNRLVGEDIPLVGRIVAVADAFDALTNDRPYRKALSTADGLDEIERHRGTQFDTKAADALVHLVKVDFAEV
ncbi:MAG TPA: HD domain-containing phosphohydrolase [Vicinamibacterales bacterium]|nr:HD domain-containing phosphohydrolase [Vicinamibacterales bacterium]